MKSFDFLIKTKTDGFYSLWAPSQKYKEKKENEQKRILEELKLNKNGQASVFKVCFFKGFGFFLFVLANFQKYLTFSFGSHFFAEFSSGLEKWN